MTDVAREGVDRSDRSSFAIVADVLRAAERAQVKSGVFRDANLNHDRGEQYLQFCIDRGLLDPRQRGFRVTDEGKAFLDEWGQIQSMMEGLDDGS